MRQPHEHKALLTQILAQAAAMVACLLKLPQAYQQYLPAHDVLSFLKDYGCYGWPGTSTGMFNTGPWLGRHGYPRQQHDGLTIVPCFSDEVPPIEPPQQHVGVGVLNRTAHMIMLLHVDHWSVPELALWLLHEARHARHRLGSKLAGLLPLDSSEDTHETNSWMFTLNLLMAWGGQLWHEAVQQEIDWLKQQKLGTTTSSIMFARSGFNWPQLDLLFGPSQHDTVNALRQRILAIQANMVYWAQQKNFRREDILHGLVKNEYA